jgi:hypothetical protein
LLSQDIVMKVLASCLLISTSLFATAALANCDMPSLIATIPDGATATEDELLSVQAAVQAYIAAMDDYIACENEELSANGDDPAADYLFLMSTRIETARNEVDAVATRFNDQVNAFRAARQPPNFSRQ